MSFDHFLMTVAETDEADISIFVTLACPRIATSVARDASSDSTMLTAQPRRFRPSRRPGWSQMAHLREAVSLGGTATPSRLLPPGAQRRGTPMIQSRNSMSATAPGFERINLLRDASTKGMSDLAPDGEPCTTSRMSRDHEAYAETRTIVASNSVDSSTATCVTASGRRRLIAGIRSIRALVL